ncbi:MAG TPA: hypothetical protein VKM93_29075 [Terriglobia bacterium]|nr:hypothetical protein [Terriglobia bacterium]
MSALKEIGYEGWLTIESFAQPEPDLGPRQQSGETWPRPAMNWRAKGFNS